MRTSLVPPAWALLVALLATALWFGRVHRDLPDFEVYRTAAARTLSAEPLYRADDGHWQYKYLPAFALAMTPFALVPQAVARAAWYALSVVLLVVFVRRSVVAVPERRLSARALSWLAVLLVGRFYVHELDLGQTNILLGVMLVTALLAIERGQTRVAGVLVGLAVFVKPYALIVLPWLPIAAGWPTLALAAAVVAAGLAVPAGVYGWAGNLALLQDWYRTVTETTAPNLLFPENISIAAAWAKWLGISSAATVLAWGSAGLVLAGAGAVVLRRGGVSSPRCLELGLLLMLVPLVSPQGWDYVILVATPGFLVLVDKLGELPRATRVILRISLAVMAFTIFDLVGRTVYMRMMEWSVLTVVAIVIAGGLSLVRRLRLA